MTKGQFAAAFWSVILFLFVNFAITAALVVSPDGRVVDLAAGYKMGSLLVGVLGLAFSIWRRRFVLLSLLAVFQFAAFLVFAAYLNSFPN